MTIESVDQILRDHGLTRENAKQYLVRVMAYNNQDLSRDAELSEDTVYRYRREFREIDAATRTRVAATLLAELHNEIADHQLEVTDA